jgi:hypothetical protein
MSHFGDFIILAYIFCKACSFVDRHIDQKHSFQEIRKYGVITICECWREL